MPGTSITLTADTADVSELLGRCLQRFGDLKTPLNLIGQIVRTSVIRNFEVEGRPDKWRELAPSTVRERGSAHPILRRMGYAGGLAGSINHRVESDCVLIGTNKVYAAVHQFGGTIKTRDRFQTLAFRTSAKRDREGNVLIPSGRFMSRKEAGRRKTGATRIAIARIGGRINIPARPFLMLQDEDIPEMIETLKEYLLG